VLSRRCWSMADWWKCGGLMALPGWGRFWRMCGVGGLAIDFGMCRLIRSSKRWDTWPTYRPTYQISYVTPSSKTHLFVENMLCFLIHHDLRRVQTLVHVIDKIKSSLLQDQWKAEVACFVSIKPNTLLFSEFLIKSFIICNFSSI